MAKGEHYYHNLRENAIARWEFHYKRALNGDIDRDMLAHCMELLNALDMEKHQREVRDIEKRETQIPKVDNLQERRRQEMQEMIERYRAQ